jgi:hypothetical protein
MRRCALTRGRLACAAPSGHCGAMRVAVRIGVVMLCAISPGCTPQIGSADPAIHYTFRNLCGTDVVVTLVADGTKVSTAAGESSFIDWLSRRPEDSAIRVTRSDGSGEVEFTVSNATFELVKDRCPT